MWRPLIFILPLILSVSTIRVPVDKEVTPSDAPSTPEATQSTPVYYLSDDTNVDSYLIPPNPHKPEEAPEGIPGLPTFLIPPSKERQTDYYVPKESVDVQSDWLPILQAQPQNKRNAPYQRLPLETIPIFFNPNQASGQVSVPVPVPSTRLEPPSVDAVNEFFIDVPEEEEVHVDENNEPIDPSTYNLPSQNENTNGPQQNQHLNPAEPTLALHLIPPRPQSFNAPTKLYPKKYAGGFKPVPIPLAQFADPAAEVPKAKPAKYFKPQSSAEVEQFTPTDEKKLYHYKKAEHQRKLKGEEEGDKQLQSADGVSEETYGEPTSAEQETSETNLRYPGHNAYPTPPRGPHAPLRYGPRPAPLRQAPEPSPPQDVGPAAPAPDGRTEFRMHGMKGPHSYQFGYDTGKGKNRQFRYEERDNDGLVKGHYGYVDRAGKLRVVNYSAHPEYGFRAEEPVEKQS